MIPPLPYKDIVLASSSPRRAAILSDIGIPFRVVPVECEEILLSDDPVQTVWENASRKMRASLAASSSEWIITADTVVAIGGIVLGKPADWEEAFEMLSSYSGKTQNVFTGVAFHSPIDGSVDVRVCASSVRFKELDSDTIRDYISIAKPFDRAGAYDIDEHGEMIISSFSGSFSNIMGLPAEIVIEWLSSKGWREEVPPC